MPKIVLHVPDTIESVLRPVVLEVVREVMEATGLDQGIKIFFPGDAEVAFQPHSDLHSTGDTNSFSTNDKITIDVDEDYEKDRVLSTAVFKPESLHIFRDDRLDTYIKPGYSSTETRLNFKFRAKDKTSAMRWRDEIKNRISMGQSERLHSVKYHYLIPPEFLVILKEVHRLREQVAPYGEDWETYFKDNASQRCSILTTLAGSEPSWGVSETQMRVVGWFEFEGFPEKGSKDDDTDTWTISFSYLFRYDKPIVAAMHYPLMIHQQIIKYRPEQAVDTVQQHQRSFTKSSEDFKFFEKGHGFVGVTSQSGVAMPAWDEFLPNSVVNDTVRVYTAMCSMDPNSLTPRLLMRLDDTESWVLDTDVIAYLKSEVAYLTQPMRSVMHLTLYKGAELMSPDAIAVDADLNVSFVNTALVANHLRHCYHLRLSLVTDWSQINRSALDRLRERGPALIKLLDAADGTLAEKGLLPNLIGDSYVGRMDLYRAIEEMNRVNLSKGNRQHYSSNTVASLLVQSHRLL
jgi:hypothetical protein